MMLVTPEIDRQNQRGAITVAVTIVAASALFGLVHPVGWCGVALGPVAYWWIRRRCKRRMRVMAQPFPRVWEGILQSRVAYFQALNDQQKERFRQLVKIFLDETRITGIRTDVDETTRVLGRSQRDHTRLSFRPLGVFASGGGVDLPREFRFGLPGGWRRPAQHVGNGWGRASSGRNDPLQAVAVGRVRHRGRQAERGIHEFAHLVDMADGSIDGLPPGVPVEVARSWIEWVAEELGDPPEKRSHINSYAYTNEAEYFAVLTEYFFEAPSVLQQKAPEVYEMLEKMMRQDTASFFRASQDRGQGELGGIVVVRVGAGRSTRSAA